MTERARSIRISLSMRLLFLTILFVMLVELMVYVPSLSTFRKAYLDERIRAAQTASLALQEVPNQQVSAALAAELLASAKVKAVVLVRADLRELVLSDNNITQLDAVYDFRETGTLGLIIDSLDTLARGGNGVIMLMDAPQDISAEAIEVVLAEDDLYAAMINYSKNVLALSLVISLFTGTLIFLTLNLQFVRPLGRMMASMLAFRDRPEDADRMLRPSSRRDEIGDAERALAEMQGDLRQALNQKTHLANLGAAVSKVNHDLRNMLSTAQLASDQLQGSNDPKVRQLAPRLMRSIDRAIDLCGRTLKYGRAEEPLPNKRPVRLIEVAAEAKTALGALSDGITFESHMDPALEVMADPDQLFRVLLNLVRNAAQALGGSGTISIDAEDAGNVHHICVIDTGPGLPETVLDGLFMPFMGTTSKGGTGLGLAIAKELIEAHGGRITLDYSDARGTAFLIVLPKGNGAGEASA